MRTLGIIALVGAAVWVAAENGLPSTDIRVMAQASTTEVSPGQSFTVELAATGPAGTTWTFPNQAGSEQVDLELLPPPAEAPPSPGRATYRGAVFTLGEAEIPAITVGYRLPDGSHGSGATAPLPLQVTSALPKGEANPQPADVRPPVKLSIGASFWVALALGLALGSALVAWLVRRKRKVSATDPAPLPSIPPEEEAREALERLAASGLLEREAFRQFYIELAVIAKRYLERRLDAPVLEMTSSEVAAMLRDHPLAGPHLPVMRDLMGAADWVKFARGGAHAEVAQRHLAAVRGIVAAVEETLQAQARVAREAA